MFLVSLLPKHRTKNRVSCFPVLEPGVKMCFLFLCFGNSSSKKMFLVSCFEIERKLDQNGSKKMFLADPWNKAPAQCKTCVTNPTVANSAFKTQCSLISRAGQRVHRCITTCVNRKKINFGKVSPRRRAVHFCRCHKTDNDER